ncbi:MAG: TldD/PmbA family protein, partial [Myxococcota bacterium]|nr:TldD/PmbA family protein [Myxococcota bacterium]
VVLDEGGKRRRGRHWTAGRHRSMLEAPEAVGRKAAADAVRRLGARKIATCECPVIFDPEAGRDLLELFASCVLGSAIWRRGSYLVDRLGTEVASPCVTLVDDPLRPRAPGSRPFDGEGLPSRRNVVVERGVLRSYLLDVYAARRLGMQSTASAARSPSAGVGPATSNFILEPGERTRDELVREVRAGLLVSETMGFGFNPVTGDFSRGASGYWIENGAIAYPVSEVTLSLRFDELWRRVDAVADDLDTRAATACPTFRVSRMMVAGTG